MSFVAEVRDQRTRREIETPRIRARAASIIQRVFNETGDARQIERSLALGAACPFTTQWEREIWMDEIARAEGLNG